MVKLEKNEHNISLAGDIAGYNGEGAVVTEDDGHVYVKADRLVVPRNIVENYYKDADELWKSMVIGSEGKLESYSEFEFVLTDSKVEAERRSIPVSNETFEIVQEYSKKVGASVGQICEDAIGKYVRRD